MVKNPIFIPFKKHINCASKHFVDKIGNIFKKETIVKKYQEFKKSQKTKKNKNYDLGWNQTNNEILKSKKWSKTGTIRPTIILRTNLKFDAKENWRKRLDLANTFGGSMISSRGASSFKKKR